VEMSDFLYYMALPHTHEDLKEKGVFEAVINR
jgi:hypothetical protein